MRHAQSFGPLHIAARIVSDKDRLVRPDAHAIQGSLENPGVRLHHPNAGRVDQTMKKVLNSEIFTNPVQIPVEVRYDPQFVLVAEKLE